ncbi:MAG: hypothetical protein ACLU6Y_00150 [Ruminococcus sp.]
MGKNNFTKATNGLKNLPVLILLRKFSNNYNIQVLSDYNTATAEYNFILFVCERGRKSEMYGSCTSRLCGKKFRRSGTVSEGAYMNFGISDISEDEYRAKCPVPKSPEGLQTVYLSWSEHYSEI